MKLGVKKQPRRLVHDLSVGEVKPITGSVTFEETKAGDWIPSRVYLHLPQSDDELRSSSWGYTSYPRVLASSEQAEAQQIIAVMREIIAIVDNAQERQ